MNAGVQAHAAVWWAAGLMLIALGLRAFEQMNVFIPEKTLYALPGAYGFPFEEAWLETADGVRLHSWWFPLPGDGPVVLYSHGNGGNISTRLEVVKRLRQAGASVLAYDYRGYGKSPGTPTEAGTYRDGEAAWKFLVETKNISARRIVLLGESLGNGVAVELALRRPAAGLIFESGFTSIVAMGKEVFPALPVDWMARYRYDNLAKIGKVRCPVLVLHSPQDEVIPFKMGREIFEAAPEPKRFFELRGDHNEGYLGSPGYVETLRSFLVFSAGGAKAP